MNWPTRLELNAWTGEGTPSAVPAPGALGWALNRQLPHRTRPLAAPEPADLRDWWNPAVGWGVVLPDDDTLSVETRVQGRDAPPAIRRLIEARGNAPVLRYRPDLPNTLRRYEASGSAADLSTSGTGLRGTGTNALPRYLLLVGSPKSLPWALQYALNTSSFVGRLDLPDDALERYVDALIDGWSASRARVDRPLVWSVEHSSSDITWLMRGAIATPIAERLRADPSIGEGLGELSGDLASAAALLDTLRGFRPGFVLTTSHGMTGPLDDSEAMGRLLGVPVDRAHTPLDVTALLDAWEPDGAIWYAHACCSAGSDDGTRYAGLVAPESDVMRTLEAVGSLGARLAPLPQALLGAERPLGAFVGHIEPTFDWTLRSPVTGELFTRSLQEALYGGLFRRRPEPVGLALHRVHDEIGALLAQWEAALRRINTGSRDAEPLALRAQLMALDRQSLVILGDPTVTLPLRPTAGVGDGR